MELRVPGDKSISQRGLIMASLARGRSRLRGLLTSEDPCSTAGVLRALGVSISPLREDEVIVDGRGLRDLETTAAGPLDCGNSGTCARLMMGVLAGQRGSAELTGDASLRGRPMERVIAPLREMGTAIDEIETPGRLPIRIHGGRLDPGTFATPVASAQVKSALLFAGLTGGAPVEISEPGRSRDHTERMLVSVGVPVVSRASGSRWLVSMPDPPDRIDPLDLDVPADVSSAAFFLVLGILGGAGPETVLRDVGVNDGRTGVLRALGRMGAEIVVSSHADKGGGEPVATLTARPSDLSAVDIGGDEIPDLIDEIPILAVAAARARGTTRISGARELRVKETDRIHALATNLRGVGVQVEQFDHGLEIEGSEAPLNGSVHTFGDHRIAMAFGVLGALKGNTIHVDDPGAADVSFPGFWTLLAEVSDGA